MKKRILFICNTYMQLITAVQIKRKMYKDEEADLILTDHSVLAEEAARGVSATGVFDRVKMVETKYVYTQGIMERITDVFRLVFHVGKKYKSWLWDDGKGYDFIFYYNFEMSLYSIADASIKVGKMPTFIQYEEGLSSYNAIMLHAKFGLRGTLICTCRKLLGKCLIFENTSSFYCYCPEIFKTDSGKSLVKIPSLDRKDHTLVTTLNRIFDYDPSKADFHKKYIFFASSADIDGENVEEEKLVKKVAEIVGVENLLVKTHPRDGRSIYEDSGIEVMKHSNVPWEVIQLNHDFTEHIFLTLGSGSVLSASAMLDDQITTYYFYPMVRERNEAFFQKNETIIGKTLEGLYKLGKCKTHKICDTLKPLERQAGEHHE